VTVVECRCTTLTELYGAEAGDYVTGHLKPDGDAYVCPDTGRRWALDDHDPVQTRLAQV
jgi:hypothetical protein